VDLAGEITTDESLRGEAVGFASGYPSMSVSVHFACVPLRRRAAGSGCVRNCACRDCVARGPLRRAAMTNVFSRSLFIEG